MMNLDHNTSFFNKINKKETIKKIEKNWNWRIRIVNVLQFIWMGFNH